MGRICEEISGSEVSGLSSWMGREDWFTLNRKSSSGTGLRGGNDSKPFSGKLSSGAWLRDLTDAIRFWEPRRMVYKLVFVLFAAIWLMVTWPHFRPAFTQPSFLLFGVLVRRPGFVGQCLLFCRLPRRHPNSALTSRDHLAQATLGAEVARHTPGGCFGELLDCG
jgi:hypothetical protein